MVVQMAPRLEMRRLMDMKSKLEEARQDVIDAWLGLSQSQKDNIVLRTECSTMLNQLDMRIKMTETAIDKIKQEIGHD